MWFLSMNYSFYVFV
ncbi:hypothetical protein RDI58_014965 [Solanum bulbocastanum]|uniref:Uncharacterized protein n=1 Tax=Solanum bulbocastanum TaxID=147425 RepID=A0AAN8TEM1_SOLBU